jgi:hypothetical protein
MLDNTLDGAIGKLTYAKVVRKGNGFVAESLHRSFSNRPSGTGFCYGLQIDGRNQPGIAEP